MIQDRVDGVKRSHTLDGINEILFSDEDDLVIPVTVVNTQHKEKPTKKGTKTKATSGTRRSSRKTTKESKTDSLMDFSD